MREEKKVNLLYLVSCRRGLYDYITIFDNEMRPHFITIKLIIAL